MKHESIDMTSDNATNSAAGDAADLLAGARRLLLMHEALGVPPYPLTPELRKFLQSDPAATGKAHQASVVPPVGTFPAKTAPPPTAPPSARTEAPRKPNQEPAATLDHVRETALACNICRLGRESAARVFGEGREGARLFIVGEAPGDENLSQSLAFSGELRELLVKMLAAIDLSLDDVYLTNIMKCPPHEGKEQAMARHCLVILREQIRAAGPKMILTMGPLPAAVLLHSAKPLLQLRGRVHNFHGVPLITTYHPSFLLRHQEMKKATWQDLQLLQRQMKKS